MAYDDPPDDMSDHPDHPENHNFVFKSVNVLRRDSEIECATCGIKLKDHPYSHNYVNLSK